METNFKILADCFKNIFPANQFSFNSDDITWIYAAPKNLPTDSIHYELIKQDNLFFIEFSAGQCV